MAFLKVRRVPEVLAWVAGALRICFHRPKVPPPSGDLAVGGFRVKSLAVERGKYCRHKSQNWQITRASPGGGFPGRRGGPWVGRRRRRSGHIRAASRNDGPWMLPAGGGSPHLWAIVAAGTTSMGHRCGCPARRSSIDVPWVRFRGSEFWPTSRRGPDGTGPPALPASASTGIPGIPGIQGSPPPPAADTGGTPRSL